MADLNGSIKDIKGIGDKKAQAFARLGVFTLYDLISFFPKKYEDRSAFKPVALTVDGEHICIKAVCADEPRLVHVRRGLDMVKFRIADETGVADVTYFNQSWMKNNIIKGCEYNFYGKVEVSGRHRSIANPIVEKSDSAGILTNRIMPVYGLTSGLSQKDILNGVRVGINECGEQIPELIPDDILRLRKLARAGFAFKNIHMPTDFSALEIARRRLIYEELFVLSCALGTIRKEHVRGDGVMLGQFSLSDFYSRLPFEPTGAQKRSVDEAVSDMMSGKAMNRLLQGDVGSGKTLVAAALCWYVFRNGMQSAFMVPTEVLARQHYANLGKLLSEFGIKTALLIGSMSAKEKRAVKNELKSGVIDLVIGTHALLSEDVEFSRLAFAITDEQHRFGVAQRAALVAKGESPHVLVMSATPIPRTLALIIYGDLDVSILDELPPGRQTVDTYSVDESYRERLDKFILKQVSSGNQVFVVCPKVEDTDGGDSSLKSAEEYSAEMASRLKGIKIGCIHGRMKAKEKDAVMASFVNGETDVLVSTTVIEVGVDVPNATLMIIENAERFGLSQLHQLRGRVGRGIGKSYCVLVSDNDSEDVKSRLKIMCATSDGFRISEEDLRLRGPGDFFGERQHGLPEMHLADLGADTQILKTAKDDADALLAADPGLSSPKHQLLKLRIDSLYSNNFSY